MEEFLQALGMVGLIILLAVGVVAGLIASTLQGGRHKPRNVTIGVVGALLLPVISAVLAAGVLAAGGLILILALAMVGAALVLLVARAISR